MWDRRQKSINHVAAGGRETHIPMPSKAMTIDTTRRTLEELLLPATVEAIPIHLIASATDPGLGALGEAERSWVEAQGWSGKQGSVLLLPDGQGGIGGVLLGTGGEDWAKQAPLLAGVLPGALPEGDYRFAAKLPDPELAALAFLAGCYRFARYKTANEAKPKRLVLPEGAKRDDVLALAEALYFGRDLINTPANDMGPPELELAARALGARHDASVDAVIGDDLVEKNFPLIHAVGRASARAVWASAASYWSRASATSASVSTGASASGNCASSRRASDSARSWLPASSAPDDEVCRGSTDAAMLVRYQRAAPAKSPTR